MRNEFATSDIYERMSALSAWVLQLLIHILNLTQIKTILTPNKDINAYPIIYEIYLDADVNL